MSAPDSPTPSESVPTCPECGRRWFDHALPDIPPATRGEAQGIIVHERLPVDLICPRRALSDGVISGGDAREAGS